MTSSRTFLALLLCLGVRQLQAQAGGTIAGAVVDAGRRPVEAAVRVERTDRTLARETQTDSLGAFRVSGLTPGQYTVVARRVGYREARLSSVRVAEGQVVELTVTLTQEARQLSTIEVVTAPTSVDVSRPELTTEIRRDFSELLPSGREATSFIALVPGARKDQLWGGAPGVSNAYQMDGIGVSHPGIGGDFLNLSVDWIERVEVRGLGAGAEQGNFQGGIINAVTRTGTNERRGAIRTTYESERLTASNLEADELGSERAGRREVAGELLGPLVRDQLFYFVAGQLVNRDFRAPDLTTRDRDFQPTRERQQERRALAKLTWLPATGRRLDLLGGFATLEADRAGLNGADDPSALTRLSRPTTFYELAWTNAASADEVITFKLAGFTGAESRRGYAGAGVPGVQELKLGRTPTYQNAGFDERRDPMQVAATFEWARELRALGADHRLVVGAEASRGRWRDERTRNGGLTWRPYTATLTAFDPDDASTWGTVGSDWGGEVRLRADVAAEALFVQDYITIGPRVTLSPGLRYGRWTGYLRPNCGSSPCYRFDAVHDEAVDPRLGIAVDLTGRGDFALKVHWGRYHQGMYALFFDRALGGNVYTNERFYFWAPPLISGRQTFSVAERDDPRTGFSGVFREFVRDEAGRVENYRQPYVDQVTLSLERSFGSSWKTSIFYTDRRNRDIVGLVDRNLATNYSRVFNTRVDNRYQAGRVLDAYGNRLELPVLYVSNRDLNTAYDLCLQERPPCTGFAGYSAAQIRALRWNPDLVLTTVPEARRHYRQFTTALRTLHDRWQGEGSLSLASLRGNVPGVTGYGTAGARFSAGPFTRPNEAINFDGTLPDALEMEGKLWVTARLPWSLQGGLLYTHTSGEAFAPTFELNERYVYSDSTGRVLPYQLFTDVLGQVVFVERRGNRYYASRDVVDAHLEWRRGRTVLAADLFNVFGSGALTLVNTNIGDRIPTDPTSFFAAPRARVAPRALRLGARLVLDRPSLR